MTKAAGSAATTVNAINGTSLSGLATGILKNTTSTGVPSIAAASDLASLYNPPLAVTVTSGPFTNATSGVEYMGSGSAANASSAVLYNQVPYTATVRQVLVSFYGSASVSTTAQSFALIDLTQSNATVASGSITLNATPAAGTLALTLGSGTSVTAGDHLQLQWTYSGSVAARTVNFTAYVYAQ